MESILDLQTTEAPEELDFDGVDHCSNLSLLAHCGHSALSLLVC